MKWYFARYKDHETCTEKDAQMIGAANVEQRLMTIQSTQEFGKGLSDHYRARKDRVLGEPSIPVHTKTERI